MVEDFISYVLLSLLSLYLLLSFSRHYHHRRRLPPSPIGLPIIGHLHLLGPIPHQSLQRLSARHGPVFSLRLGSNLCVAVTSAEVAKDFLKTHELDFCDRPSSKALDCITYGYADFSFASYGPYWRFLKKLCMTELLGGQNLNQLHHVRQHERNRFIIGLFEKARAKKSVEVGSELMKLTNNVICRMTMSRRSSDDEGEAEEVRKLMKDILDLMGKFNVGDYIWFCRNLDLQGLDKKLHDLRVRFDRMLENILNQKEAQRRKMGGGDGDGVKDLVDILLDIMNDEKAEMRLTRENIKAFVSNILVGGTDTSAILTEWTLAELINHPEIMRKASKEMDTVVGKSRLVEESDIPNLPYLQAIVKEVLRLHPPAPIFHRKSSRDSTVGMYDIPAGTLLLVNAWAIGRDPSQWSEPLEFRPERYMGNGESTMVEVKGQHYQLLPFGSGRRGCPGRHLAMQMVQATLGAMIQCFEWEVDGGGPVDMAEGPELTLWRASPLVCTPVLRLDPMSLPL